MEETHKGKKKGLYGKSYPFCLSKQISDAQEEIRKRERRNRHAPKVLKTECFAESISLFCRDTLLF